MNKLKAIKNSVTYLLCFILTPMICALLLYLLNVLLHYLGIPPILVSTYFVESVVVVVMIGVFALITRKNGFICSAQINKIKIKPAIFFIGIGLSVFFIAMIILNLVPFLSGEDSDGSSVRTVVGIEIPLIFIAKCILAPIAEEVAYRGLIYSQLKSAFPKIASIIIVSLVFGVFHLSYSVFMLIETFVMSVFFCYLTDKYNSIVPSILIHISNNIVTTLIQCDFVDDKYAIPMFITAMIVFAVSITGICFDIRKMKTDK